MLALCDFAFHRRLLPLSVIALLVCTETVSADVVAPIAASAYIRRHDRALTSTAISESTSFEERIPSPSITDALSKETVEMEKELLAPEIVLRLQNVLSADHEVVSIKNILQQQRVPEVTENLFKHPGFVKWANSIDSVFEGKPEVSAWLMFHLLTRNGESKLIRAIESAKSSSITNPIVKRLESALMDHWLQNSDENLIDVLTKSNFQKWYSSLGKEDPALKELAIKVKTMKGNDVDNLLLAASKPEDAIKKFAELVPQSEAKFKQLYLDEAPTNLDLIDHLDCEKWLTYVKDLGLNPGVVLLSKMEKGTNDGQLLSLLSVMLIHDRDIQKSFSDAVFSKFKGLSDDQVAERLNLLTIPENERWDVVAQWKSHVSVEHKKTFLEVMFKALRKTYSQNLKSLLPKPAHNFDNEDWTHELYYGITEAASKAEAAGPVKVTGHAAAGQTKKESVNALVGVAA